MDRIGLKREALAEAVQFFIILAQENKEK